MKKRFLLIQWQGLKPIKETREVQLGGNDL